MDAPVIVLSLLSCAIIFVVIRALLNHEPTDIICGNVENSYSKGVENYCYTSSILDVAIILPAPFANNVLCIHTIWDENCIIEKVPTELFNKIKLLDPISLRARKNHFNPKKYTFLAMQEDE